MREASWNAFADRITGLALDRDAEWSGAFNALGVRFNTGIALVADGNRCSREARAR